MLISNFAALNPGQFLAQAHGDLTRFPTTDGESIAVGFHCSNRSDYRCGTAGESLSHGATVRGLPPLIQSNGLFQNLNAHLTRELQDRVSSHSRQNRARQLWGHQFAVDDEHDVHSAHFFDFVPVGCI